MFDVFEFLRNKLGCMYISDLKIYPYKEDIINILESNCIDKSQAMKVYEYVGLEVA